jgi:hypothetical protein
MSNLNPQQYAVYKGMGGKFGALQFNLQRPHYYKDKQKDFTGDLALENGKAKDGWKLREGCVFLEIASAKDKNVYDWDTKIIFALSVSDIGKLLLGLNKKGDTELMHDPGAKTDAQGAVKKFLNVKVSDQGALFSVTQAAGGDKRTHTVPMSPDEVVVLRQLLQSAISSALSW